MLKLKAFSGVLWAACLLALPAISGQSESAKAEPTDYRFVQNTSTSSGAPASLVVPVRAPFVGLKSAVRICVEGARAEMGTVSLAGSPAPVSVAFAPELPGCVVTDSIDFSSDVAGGGSVEVQARLQDGDIASFVLPVVATSPYLETESLIQVAAPLLGTVTATFPAKPVTSRTKSVVVCSAGRKALTEAKLWMPAHGHGSTATTLTLRPDGCYLVDRLNFVMVGTWELRTTWADGAGATVSFDVIRAVQ